MGRVAVQGEPGWTAVRSLKRILEDAGADTSVEVDGARYPLMELLTGMVAELRRGLGVDRTARGDARRARQCQ